MRPSLDEVVKRKKQTYSVEASAMVFTQQGKPSERGVSRMADVIVTLRIICAFIFGLSLGYRIGKG